MADLNNTESIVKKPFNRVRYVEPNYVNSILQQGSRGLHNYEFENPLEDYSIYVNLKVEVRGREIRTDYTSDKKSMTLFYSAEQGKESVSFLQGSKYPNKKQNVYGKDVYSLTTDYDRHIYLHDIVKKDDSGNMVATDASTELFGINSIDIQYNNWMVPVVTIKFTDIRGAALFSAEEARHYKEDANDVGAVADTTIEGSFFKCFFTFPYPKFTLCVKGFYGQPVSYELTCSDFRASFNSSTGNFEATAKFIGYAFSFLGDVMLNAMVAAPFSDYLGKKYWDANVGSRFVLKDMNGQTVPMMTIGEFVTRIDAAIQSASGMVASSPEAQESMQLEDARDNIESVKTAYNEFQKAVREESKNAAPTDSELASFDFGNSANGVMLVILPTKEGDTFDKAQDAYDALKEAVKDTKYSIKVDKLNPSELKAQAIFVKKGNSYTINPALKNLPPAILNSLKHDIELENNYVKTNNGESLIENHNLQYGWVFDDGGLTSDLSKDKSENETNIQENQEKISTAMTSAISDCLGFSPSIENITKMVMAHFETLNYMITMCARDIVASKRTIQSLGIADYNVMDVNVNKTDLIVPPFPKVTDHVTEEGVEKNEETWVGNFNGDWREKDVVNGLLNGINEMAKLIQAAQAGQMAQGGRLTAIMKIPLSPLDLILDKNPYGDINFHDKSSFIGHVALRMLAIIGLSTKYQSDGIDAIGQAEAVNFNDFFPNPPKEFKQWISDDNLIQVFKDVLHGIADTNTYGKDNKFAWEDRRIKETSRVPLLKDWTLATFTGDATTYLPVQDASFYKITNDLGTSYKGNYNHHPRNDKDYIITHATRNENRRYSSNKLICIESNPDRFSTIVSNQITDLQGMQSSMLEECQYNPESFKEYLQNGSKIVYYGNETSSTDNSGQQEENTDENAQNEEEKKQKEKGPQKFDDWAASYENDGLDKFIADSGHTVSNYRILFIPGVGQNGDADSEATLFTQNKYYAQDIYGKAFLYLRALSYYVKYDKAIDAMTDKDTRFTTVPLAAILYAGALCYYETESWNDLKDYVSKDLFKGIDARDDVKYDLAKYFKDWVDKKYTRIDAFLSFKSDVRAFNKKLDEIHSTFFNTSDDDIKELMDTYMSGLQVIYECVDENTHMENGYHGIKLGLRPTGYGAMSAAELVLSPYTFLKTCDCSSVSVKQVTAKDGETFIKGFLDKLKSIYQDESNSANTTNIDVEMAEDCKTDNDIKIGVYRYVKLLYDKWIADSVFENDLTMERFFGRNPDSTAADDRYFYFIDSYYNRIGDKIIVNVEKLKKQIMDCTMSDGTTLLSFLSEMYAENKCSFLCVQNFMDLSNEENMQTMFKPVSYMEMDPPDVTPNFIVMFPYESSSHLDLGENSEYQDDSFSIKEGASASNKYPEPLRSNEECGYTIPAFGVSYGKMYQSYFKDISISMENPMVTEQSIKAQFAIASMNNENQQATGNTGTATRSMVTMGQDLFTIYSNQSFTCEIDMMGNAWIQPLMYFELLNVPMFKGTYLIEKVTHHIEAGNMTTHITGVRMANTTTKIKKGWFFMADPVQTGVDDIEQMENQLADVTNDCDYAKYPVGEGAIAGLLISQNGISALNVIESAAKLRSGSNAWYKAGDKNGVYFQGENKRTYGPGVKDYIKNNDTSAKGLINAFKAALKDKSSIVKGYKTKINPKYSQKGWDSVVYAQYWGIQTNNLMKECPNDNSLAEWWKTKAQSQQKDKCMAWYYILKSQTPTNVNSKAIYDAYVSPNMELMKALGYVTPPTANDTTQNKGKDKGIWEDFAYAVNQSAMATPSCGLNVAEQPIDKNSGYLFDPTTPQGTSEKLGVVFDIILSTYNEYIQELWWVALNEHSNKGPNRLKVVLSKKPVFGNTKVGMLINKGISGDGKGKFKFSESSSPFTGINTNSNKTYRRSIVKFYSKNGRYHPENENYGVYGMIVQSKIPKSDWKDLKPTSCADVMTSAGGEGGGSFLPSKPLGDGKFDAGKAANYLISKYHNVKLNAYPRHCAGAVHAAVDSAGLKTEGANGYRYPRGLNKFGFKEVLRGKTNDASYASYIKNPSLGDIMGCTDGNNASAYGHACMFCGKEYGWYSDCPQSNAYPYGSHGPGDFWIMRYEGLKA